MEIDFYKFDLAKLFILHSAVSLGGFYDSDESEKELFIQVLGREDPSGEFNEKEIKRLNKLIFDPICKKLSEGEGKDLKELIIDLRNQEKENLIKISEFLASHKELESLDLSIDGESMKVICESLKTTKSIKKLRVFENEDEVAGSFLSESLESNDSIEILTFDYARLNKDSAKYLFKFLHKNETLKEINLLRSRWEKEPLTHLMKNLEKNKTIERLIFTGNNLTNEHVAQLSKNIKINKIW